MDFAHVSVGDAIESCLWLDRVNLRRQQLVLLALLVRLVRVHSPGVVADGA